MFLLSYRQLQASTWLVFAGVTTHGLIKQEAGVSVKKIIYHPLYNDNSLDYDIALMKLQVPLNFSGMMLLCPSPICGVVCLIPQLRDGQNPASSEPTISEQLFKDIQPGTWGPARTAAWCLELCQSCELMGRWLWELTSPACPARASFTAGW